MPAGALAHPGDDPVDAVEQALPPLPLGAQAEPQPVAPPDQTFEPGPCTAEAREAMPDGKNHDHLNVSQHRFGCRVRQLAFDSLRGELAARNDVVLGEMDVERDLAAVAVAYPESGFLLFDVSRPAKPRFLSWYRSSECEGAVIDVDCGAYVDLSRDATTAFLSSQDLSVVPGGFSPGVTPAPVPGVEVVDVSQPKQPSLTQVYPVVSQGGVHTSRSHVIPARARSNGPRDPGEYLFSIANGFGIEISRVNRANGRAVLTPVSRIDVDEVHDTFLQNDPLTHRTYLYIAAGLESGFYVYDVTDPAQPKLLAEWDLTPRCEEDWYSHTVDTVIRGGRRYVTMPAELFKFGNQSTEDRGEGCGKVLGNGDKVGPLWIVDATDFSKLRPASASGDGRQRLIERNSRRALVATWRNPAHREGGNLIFSPHNQQVVGNRIYLSHYHGGVYVLDATDAFHGRSVRPRELGFVVPHGPGTRPIYEATIPPLMPFFSTFPPARPTIWDMVFARDHIFAADEYGGFYSFQYRGDR
jgi:hypothetical protein